MTISYTEITKPSDPTYTEITAMTDDFLLINSTDFLLINSDGDKLITFQVDNIYTIISKPT